MKTKTKKIRRLCACGCRQITNYGREWIRGHHSHKHTQKSKRKMSLSAMGNTNGKGNKGLKRSEETKLKMSLSMTKSHPNDEYCEVWRDVEYKKDLRKDYCENVECKGISKNLLNHHINLNKYDCRPHNIMTLCQSCHRSLHNLLNQVKDKFDILTINRGDHITYIYKRTGQIVTTIKRIEECL